MFLNLITVFVVALSLVLGHSLSWAQAGGGALVFSGIALVTSGPARTRAREKVPDSRNGPRRPTGS